MASNNHINEDIDSMADEFPPVPTHALVEAASPVSMESYDDSTQEYQDDTAAQEALTPVTLTAAETLVLEAAPAHDYSGNASIILGDCNDVQVVEKALGLALQWLRNPSQLLSLPVIERAHFLEDFMDSYSWDDTATHLRLARVGTLLAKKLGFEDHLDVEAHFDAIEEALSS